MEYKVEEILVRTAVFMANRMVAICTEKPRADGFGIDRYGKLEIVESNFAKKVS